MPYPYSRGYGARRLPEDFDGALPPSSAEVDALRAKVGLPSGRAPPQGPSGALDGADAGPSETGPMGLLDRMVAEADGVLNRMAPPAPSPRLPRAQAAEPAFDDAALPPTSAEISALRARVGLDGALPAQSQPPQPRAFGSLFRGGNRLQQVGAMAGQQLGIFSPETAARSIARDEADIAQYPVPQETQRGLQEISEAPGAMSALRAILSNPSAVMSTVGESAVTSLAPLITGAAGAAGGLGIAGPPGAAVGFAGGVGAGSFAVEFNQTIADTMAASGVDMTKPDAIVAAFKNPELMGKAREMGLKRGIPIMVFDALSAGVAGRLLSPVASAVGKGLTAKAVGAGAEIGAQAGLGGAGEAAAQIVSEGAVKRPGEVALEGVAEIIPGIGEAAIGSIARGKPKPAAPPPTPVATQPEAVPQQPVTPETPPQATQPVPVPAAPTPIPAAPVTPPGPEFIPLPDADTGQQVAWFNPATGETRPLDYNATIVPPKSAEVPPSEPVEKSNTPAPVAPQVQAAPGLPPSVSRETAPEGDGTRAAPIKVETPEHIPAVNSGPIKEPTLAQARAGNFQKTHLKLFGLPIAIETHKGQVRRSKDPERPWEVVMPAAYGYLKKTEGYDGDEVDVYVGPEPRSRRVFVIDQVDADTKKPDEHKVFMGFTSQAEVEQTYGQAFSDGRAAERVSRVREFGMPEFKQALAKGEFKKAPKGQPAPLASPPLIKTPESNAQPPPVTQPAAAPPTPVAPQPTPEAPATERPGVTETPSQPADIHAIAQELSVPFDDAPEFMAATERLTGKRRLDDLTPDEISTVALELRANPASFRAPEKVMTDESVISPETGVKAPESTPKEGETGQKSPILTLSADQAREALKTGIDPRTGQRPKGNSALREMRDVMKLVVKRAEKPELPLIATTAEPRTETPGQALPVGAPVVAKETPAATPDSEIAAPEQAATEPEPLVAAERSEEAQAERFLGEYFAESRSPKAVHVVLDRDGRVLDWTTGNRIRAEESKKYYPDSGHEIVKVAPKDFVRAGKNVASALSKARQLAQGRRVGERDDGPRSSTQQQPFGKRRRKPGAETEIVNEDPEVGVAYELRYQPKFEAEREAVTKDLQRRLNQLGLRDLGLKVADRIDFIKDDAKASVNGFHWKRIIAVALDSEGGTLGTLNHEAVHALRSFDLITDEEWAILESHAPEWRRAYGIDSRYKDELEEIRNEEAVAEAFRVWSTPPKDGAVARIFKKLWNALRAIGNAFRSSGFKDVDDIFERIDSGEVGRRDGRVGDNGRREPRASLKQDPGAFERLSSEPQATVTDYLSEQSLGLMERLKGAVSKDAISESVDRWRTGFQDRFLPLLRVQQAVEAQLGRPLEEGENAYGTEILFSGSVGSRLETLSEAMVRPLLLGMNERGISQAELEAYLYARHAPERNARIASINPKFKPGEGSGMTDEDAKAIVGAVKDSGKQADYDALAAMVDKIRDFALQERVDAGLLSQADADRWRQTYKNYVPLRGKAEIDPEVSADRPRTGKGFSVRGKESQRAFGRETPASDIIPYVILQAQEAVVRAGKNRVTQAFHDLAKAAPNEAFWKADKITTKPVWNNATGQVEYRAENRILAEDEPFTISTKIEGVEHRVTLSRDSPAAVRLAQAMRGLKDDQIGMLIKTLGGINRWLSKASTQWNPEFVVVNAFRDIQTGLANLQGIDVGGITKATVKHYPGALAASTRSAFGKESGDWGKWATEFRQSGGRVYFNQVEDVAGIRARLERELKDATSGPSASKAIRSLFRFIEKTNVGVENGLRLSAYRAARESGMTTPQAARLAKGLTVNFNKRGSFTPLANSLYLFFNASVQGSARLFMALKHRRVQQVVGAAIATGAMLEMLNVMLSDVDDDGEPFYDRKVTDFEKSRNLIVMLGGSTYLKLPLPYGYNVAFGLGRSIAELLRGKEFGDVASNLVGMIVDSFNPVGGAANLANLVSPTVLDPVVDIWGTNKDFTGRSIRPEQPQYGAQIPEHMRYWGSVSPLSRTVTDTLNSLTGGDDVTPGAISISPEVLDHGLGVALGGAGAFFSRNVDLVAKLLDPSAEIGWNDIAFARRLIGEKPPWIDRSLFYERSDEITQARSDLRDYAQRGEREKGAEFRAENRDLLSLYTFANRTRSALADLRNARERAELRKERGSLSAGEYTATINRLREREDALITRFNKAYVERLKPAAGRRETEDAPRRQDQQAEDREAGNDVRADVLDRRAAIDGPRNQPQRQQEPQDIEPEVRVVHRDQTPARSSSQLAEAVKSGDADELLRLAEAGVTWTRQDAVRAARRAGLTATANLLEQARTPVRPEILERMVA